MNFIDWYRNATNGTYTFGNSNNNAPDTFFDDIPFFEIGDYTYFQGVYTGKTWNRTGNKYGDTWISLGNVDYEQGTICVKAEWYNGLVGSVHLEAGINQSNIFTGEGHLYFQGQARYAIQMFLFLYGDYRTLKGACILTPLTNEGYMQCSTFTLWK